MYSRLPRMPRFDEMLVHEERHLVAISKPAGLLTRMSQGLRTRLEAQGSLPPGSHALYQPRRAIRTAYRVVHHRPAGLLSQPDHTGEASAICMAAEWLASTDRRGRAHLVHRLDRRVSGLLLIARSTKAASRLSQSFAKRDVLKTYLALCNRTAHAPALATGTPYPYPYPYP